MKDQKFHPRRILYLGFLSFFGTGFFPKAPGTVGSLATIPLIYFLASLKLSFFTHVAFICLLTILSCFVAHYVQEKEQVHDPGWIVIDEVIGMLITWLFIFPSTETNDLIICFLLFRFFDIIKVFPANWCDSHVKNGAGTILDDVISAFYAGFFLLLVKKLLT